MLIEFYKYQATGNDFIIVYEKDKKLSLTKELIANLCYRRFGIGADGLIILKISKEFDFEMKYYNADGNESTMCGNGGRSIVSFAKYLGLIEYTARFNAIDGYHFAEISDNGIVKLKMSKPKFSNADISDKFIDTGSPHFVKIVEDIKSFDVYNEGKRIRHSSEFDDIGGTNVNFVEILENNKIFVRTFERGVEDETFSCGTGVVAASILMHRNKKIKSNITKIKTLGGDLQVEFDEKLENVFLTGPAKMVFKGKIDYDE